MLYIMPAITLNFAQQERKNSFLLKQLREENLGLFFLWPSSEMMQQIYTWL